MKKLLLVSVLAVAMIGCTNQAQEVVTPEIDSTVVAVVDTTVVVDSVVVTVADTTAAE